MSLLVLLAISFIFDYNNFLEPIYKEPIHSKKLDTTKGMTLRVTRHQPLSLLVLLAISFIFDYNNQEKDEAGRPDAE